MMKLRRSGGGSDAARLARCILTLVFVVIAAGQSHFVCPGVKTILDKPEELKKMTLRNTACLHGHGEQCQPIAPAFCSLKDPCDSTPCQNGGTCTPGTNGTYSCSCGPVFTGVNCETRQEWILQAGRVYHVSTTKCTYTNCRAICLDLGADLITIESAEEQTFAEIIAPGGFWLSIYETTGTVPGTWVVNPESTMQITYSKWSTHQPDVASHRCAYATSSDYSNNWNDYTCQGTYTTYYICEK